jgi:hypothetical protein
MKKIRRPKTSTKINALSYLFEMMDTHKIQLQSIIRMIDLSNPRLNLSSPALGMDSEREWLATLEYRQVL